MKSKRILRNSIRSLFKDIAPEKLDLLSYQLSKNLRNFFESKSFKFSDDFLFGAFAPMRDEVKWHLALEDYSDRMCFPGIVDGKMSFFHCSMEDLELKSIFDSNILCPRADAPEVIPDVLIVPGRAFDDKGNRLGRGKGFYDRYLHHYGGLTIGVCLEDQIVINVPVELFDRKVDYVITDKRVILVSDNSDTGEKE